MNAARVRIGEKLGPCKAMAGPMTSAELAHKSAMAGRYRREWLGAQAAGRFVAYHAMTQRFVLPHEQALALAVANFALSDRRPQ